MNDVKDTNMKTYLQGYANIMNSINELGIEERFATPADVEKEIESKEAEFQSFTDSYVGQFPEEMEAGRTYTEQHVAEISNLMEQSRKAEARENLQVYAENAHSNFKNYYHDLLDGLERAKEALLADKEVFASKVANKAKADEVYNPQITALEEQISQVKMDAREIMKVFAQIKNGLTDPRDFLKIAEVSKAVEEKQEIEEEKDEIRDEKVAEEVGKAEAVAAEERPQNTITTPASTPVVETNNGELRWAPGYTQEQIDDAISRGITEPVGPEYEQWLQEVVPLGNVNEPGILYKEAEKAPEIRWAAGYTQEQIDDALSRGIDAPFGPEYEQWLNEVTPLGNVNEPGILYTGPVPVGYEPPKEEDKKVETQPVPPIGGNTGDVTGNTGNTGNTGDSDNTGDNTSTENTDDEDLELPAEIKNDGPQLPTEVAQGYQPEYTTEAPTPNYVTKRTFADGAKKVIKGRKSMLLKTAPLFGIAAFGLFGVPVAGAVLCGAGWYVGMGAATRIQDYLKEKAQNHKLSKLAESIGAELVFDYNAGMADFAIKDENGKYIPLRDKYDILARATEAYLKENGYETKEAIAELMETDPDRYNELEKEAQAKFNKDLALATGGKLNITPRSIFNKIVKGEEFEIKGGASVRDVSDGKLSEMYDTFGGIPAKEARLSEEDIEAISTQGLSKISGNVENLQSILTNAANKYNLSQEQTAQIKEAIEYQEKIREAKGLKGTMTRGMAKVSDKLTRLVDKLTGERHAKPVTLFDNNVVEENEIPEIPEVVEEEIEDLDSDQVQKITEQQIGQDVSQIIEEQQNVQTNPNGMSEEEIQEALMQNDITAPEAVQPVASEVAQEVTQEVVPEASEVAQEVVPEAATVAPTSENVIETLINALNIPDDHERDIAIQECRQNGYAEDDIDAALTALGFQQEQQQAQSMGL